MRIEQQTLTRPIKLKILKQMGFSFLKTSGSESNGTALSIVLSDAVAEADALVTKNKIPSIETKSLDDVPIDSMKST
jgi:hypothetical protein